VVVNRPNALVDPVDNTKMAASGYENVKFNEMHILQNNLLTQKYTKKTLVKTIENEG